MSTLYMQPVTGKRAYCAACGWEGASDNVNPGISDFAERVSPGEVCPLGTCPECGALAHIKHEKTDGHAKGGDE